MCDVEMQHGRKTWNKTPAEISFAELSIYLNIIPSVSCSSIEKINYNTVWKCH